MNGDLFPEVRINDVDDPNRRYTPRKFMAWIMERAGVSSWDLDVAADEESHHAPRWFSLLPYKGSAGVDGLAQSWLPTWTWHHYRAACLDAGANVAALPVWRIFDNPPFDDLAAWMQKTWATLEEAARDPRGFELRIAMVLPGNRHEQPFWQEHVEPFRDGRAARFGYRLECHFPPRRQAYAKPGSNGVPVGSADFPSAVLVWRRS